MAEDEKIARLRESFNRFDKDGSGFIDKEEIREVVKGIYKGMDVPESIILAEADVSILLLEEMLSQKKRQRERERAKRVCA